jgi:hypothetical protein
VACPSTSTSARHSPPSSPPSSTAPAPPCARSTRAFAPPLPPEPRHATLSHKHIQ